MGLDMYLSRKTYVKNWSHQKPEDRHEITVKKGEFIRQDIKPERISYIVEQVAYWRKANAIHQWFVDNCQGGNDDCRDYDVSSEQIEELMDLCKKVLAIGTADGPVSDGTSYHPGGKVEQHTHIGPCVADPEVAAELLPTASGFFFGTTEYDEWYLYSIQQTIEQLEPLLTDGGDGDYSYHASW